MASIRSMSTLSPGSGGTRRNSMASIASMSTPGTRSTRRSPFPVRPMALASSSGPGFEIYNDFQPRRVPSKRSRPSSSTKRAAKKSPRCPKGYKFVNGSCVDKKGNRPPDGVLFKMWEARSPKQRIR